MIKKLICIECPNGCVLSVDAENGTVRSVCGNDCPRGETYAYAEIEHPLRVLTSTVAAEGLTLRMVPVRTDRPLPKGKLMDAMREVRAITVRSSLKAGDVIAENICGLGVNLIVTRSVREL